MMHRTDGLMDCTGALVHAQVQASDLHCSCMLLRCTDAC
jgi:hypothetical protein